LVDIDAEAERRWKEAWADEGYRPRGRLKDKGQFKARYRDGMRLDDNHHWRRVDWQREPPLRVPAKADLPKGLSPADWALDALLGDPPRHLPAGKGPARSSFVGFQQALEEVGGVSRDEVVATLRSLAKPGQSVDSLRHQLKRVFRPRLLAACGVEVGPGGRVGRRVDALSDAVAHERALAAFRRMNSSDQGSFAQIWFKARYHHSKTTHTEVSIAAEGQLAGLKRNRRIDELGADGTIWEIKSGGGPLSAEEWEQYRDYQRMMRKKVTAPDGATIEVTSRHYAFLDPAGAKANIGDLWEDVADMKTTTVTVIRDGRPLTLNEDTLLQLRKLGINSAEDVKAWLDNKFDLPDGAWFRSALQIHRMGPDKEMA
jgi:hypothetical protein